MLRRRLYYALKPFLPWAMRMAVRRIFARRKREQSKAIWPIDESTSRPPEGWTGWPEGRKFAFVLTHDVEGPEGLAKVRQLAELEMKLGFRSSFNFIPEGPYQVPPELRAWLTTNGFEVGVHDLHHDGKLFSSRRGFAEKAKKINNYLREWQARGYRSGFMLRDLGWLHDLDIQYDASTFDTDPFEPQAESAGTIFPYWISSPEAPEAKDKAVSAESLNTQPSTLSSFASVSQSENCGQTPGGQQATTARPTSSFASVPSTDRPPSTEQPPTVHRPPSTGSRAGYVELPYTLPQDSTLFLLLQEKSPDIWLRKLDWIVAHGGMALLNVHPDYINFAGTPRTNREYPEAFYAEFLHTISKKYAGQFWNPLPGKLAEWHHQTHRAASLTLPRVSEADSPPGGFTGLGGGRLRGKRAAVILFSYYPIDPRPRRAAEALVEAGMEVDLLCLSSGPDQPKNERLNGVQVYRVNIVRERSTKSRYVWQYVLFLVTAFWFLSRRSLRRRYDVVHVHNMPDILVFATLVPKIRGTKIMLDLHDPMPELMASIRLLHAASWHVTALRILERWSIRFASVVITPNIAFKNLFASRSCRPEKITIVMNSPEEAIFDRARLEQSRPLVRNKNEFRIMHHGLIAYRHGVDLLVEAVAQVRMAIPGVRLDLYGARTPFLDTVLATAERLGVADIVTFHGEIDQDGIARAILKSDLGVVPNRRSAFTDLNFPTRIFEYLAMNRPVIAPATRGIRDYFTPDQLIKFDPGNVADLVAKILWVKNQPEAVQAKVERGVRVYRAHLWSEEKAGFIDLVGNLVLGTRQYRPKRVCMITHSFYESDNRVTRYAEALAARGDQVDVLSLRRSPDLARTETINGVRVFRIQDRFGKSERSILSFLWPAVRFLISSSCRVTWRHARERYDLLHVHNIPDFLVFAVWYPKLTGAEVILDIHDIVPEFFGSKFGPDKKGAMRLLHWMERVSARFADHIIISNHLWLELYATRTRTQGKCSVFINNVDSRVFQPQLRTRQDGKLIVLFPGGLHWHQGLDIALRAFVRVSRELPHAEFHIYGDGNMKPTLVALTAELGLGDHVRFFDPVRITEIARVMANADLGVVPKRADSFGNEAYSTKIMEFMSLGVPVVVSRTKIDQFYFTDSVVKFFESGNAEALAAAMLEVLRDTDLRQQLIANAAAYAVQNSWDSRKGDYLQLADTLK